MRIYLTTRAGAIGIALALAGVTLQLVGLALDAWLHAANPLLAAAESVFSLENPGHVLFGAGLALAAVGTLTSFYSGLGAAGEVGASRWLAYLAARRVLSVVPGLLVSGLGTAVLVLAATGVGAPSARYDHAQAATASLPGGAAAPVARSAAGAGGPGAGGAQHGHADAEATGALVDAAGGGLDRSRHDLGVEVRISVADLAALNAALDEVREVTAPYADVTAAWTAGYVQITPFIPGLGAHFIHPLLLLDRTFDHSRPQVLLYEPSDEPLAHGWRLVGISYVQARRGSTPPEGFPGPLDVWHWHENLCFSDFRGAAGTLPPASGASGSAAVSTAGLVVGAFGGTSRVGVGSSPAAVQGAVEWPPPGLDLSTLPVPRVSVGGQQACLNQGGIFLPESPWMVHAWVWKESPEGVFSHRNSAVR